MSILRTIAIALATTVLTSCATVSQHQWAAPSREWQTRNGQLLYRNANATLIGEVLVRFSKSGDFELTFSKGPGVALLVVRQDSTFAEVKGALPGRGWSGPIDRAPPPLRGWLQLREKLIDAQDRQSVRYANGSETFLFRF